MTLPTDTKATLRRRLRAELKSLVADSRASASTELCMRVRASAAWQSARAVLVFFPDASEPDITPLLEDALTKGKLLALPRFDTATAAYEPVQITDLAREVVAGPFLVREPVAGCPRVALNRLDLALVPGLGFDAHGGRLGRGKGHYDQLLAGFSGLKIGVAFDCQIVAEVPREPHDIALDAVVTPLRWIEVKTN